MPSPASLKNLRPWKPGQSGNPKGWPTAPKFSEADRHEILVGRRLLGISDSGSIASAASNTRRSSSAGSAGDEPRAREAAMAMLTASRRFSSPYRIDEVTPRTPAATLAPPAAAAGRGRTRHRCRGSDWRPPTP
jgi:hypothetical protein